MILSSDPIQVKQVAGHWRQVHKLLSGGDGDGARGEVDKTSSKDSIAGLLQKAVDDSLEHWRGTAADAFKKRAERIVGDLRNGAAYANLTASNLDAVGDCLSAAKEEMRDIHEPSLSERAKDKLNDDGRDDAQMRKDLAAGADAETAAEANEKTLSLTKERQLHAVAVMERLAVSYSTVRSNIKPPPWDKDKEGIPKPREDVSLPPAPLIVGPSGGPGASGSSQRPWSPGGSNQVTPAPTGPRDKGITGGSQIPASKTQTDGLSPGLTGRGQGPGTSAPTGPGTGSSPGNGGSSSGNLPAPGGPGLGPGRGGTGRGLGRGGSTGTPGTAGRGGRAGMGGIGGGMGSGAAARGSTGATGRGSLAKTRGGTVGAAKGMPAKGTGAGAGLHGSRGGTNRPGMTGAAAGGAAGRDRRRGDEKERGQRPDYLVEDEETWVSEEDRKRNVPKNIE